jgi:predicted molibdopterin-dependent oxidoreductase YjgC
MVRCSRRTTVELLMASSTHIPLIQELAAQMGVAEPRVRLEPNDCILCGLCARACKEIVGISAISLVDRGIDKKVKPPFEIASRDCIGCGTCVLVCPTGAIKLEDIGEPKLVHHWASDFEVIQCRICGDHYLSPEPVTDYERLFAEETH